MFSKSGKHFANPAVGRMHNRGSVPEHSKETMRGGHPNDPNKGGDIEADHKGTAPHPVTGVHEVTISHHGGGKAMTHVKHDGGHTEHNQHGSLGEAFAHAQSLLPDDAQAGGDQGGTPQVGGVGESAESLGGMMGGGSY